jgi:hypothetical protein
MTQEERNEKIESYGNAYINLIAALNELPKEMWQYKPSPAEWSIHDIIIHLADSEANGYIRCRRFIAEPGTMVMAYNQDLWASELKYYTQNTEDALELFRLLRLTTYNLIKNIPAQTWANIVEHSESGIITMNDWLGIYENHVSTHIAQMKRNFENWKKQKV